MLPTDFVFFLLLFTELLMLAEKFKKKQRIPLSLIVSGFLLNNPGFSIGRSNIGRTDHEDWFRAPHKQLEVVLREIIRGR